MHRSIHRVILAITIIVAISSTAACGADAQLGDALPEKAYAKATFQLDNNGKATKGSDGIKTSYAFEGLPNTRSFNVVVIAPTKYKSYQAFLSCTGCDTNVQTPSDKTLKAKDDADSVTVTVFYFNAPAGDYLLVLKPTSGRTVNTGGAITVE